MQMKHFAAVEWIDRFCDRLEDLFEDFGLILPCTAGITAAPAVTGYGRSHPPVQLAVDPESNTKASPPESAESSEAVSPKKNLLKDKVNSILSAADEDDEDSELLEELSKPKKKFFGLFG